MKERNELELKWRKKKIKKHKLIVALFSESHAVFGDYFAFILLRNNKYKRRWKIKIPYKKNTRPHDHKTTVKFLFLISFIFSCFTLLHIRKRRHRSSKVPNRKLQKNKKNRFQRFFFFTLPDSLYINKFKLEKRYKEKEK